MNVAATWIASQLEDGHSLATATASLNEDLGTSYRTSRICEWRAGARPIPAPVRRYMLEFALFYALRAEGVDVHNISDASWQKIFASIA